MERLIKPIKFIVSVILVTRLDNRVTGTNSNTRNNKSIKRNVHTFHVKIVTTFMFVGKKHDTVTPDVYQFAALVLAARRCLPPSRSLAKRSQSLIVSTTSASTARH